MNFNFLIFERNRAYLKAKLQKRGYIHGSTITHLVTNMMKSGSTKSEAERYIDDQIYIMRLELDQSAQEVETIFQKQSKYRAKRTRLDGIEFDSQAEAQRYAQLKLYQKAGIVKSIELQPKFIIVDSYIGPDGKKVQPTYYKADFLVEYPDGRKEVEDVKSRITKTPLYRLKKKLFEQRYSISIKEVGI